MPAFITSSRFSAPAALRVLEPIGMSSMYTPTVGEDVSCETPRIVIVLWVGALPPLNTAPGE